ncbi:MAG: hypothetical protein K9G62_06330 [Alphaproteobacteria bacterium]|nr:hypothetical protein [Alphaproteobacteria bacterium]
MTNGLLKPSPAVKKPAPRRQSGWSPERRARQAALIRSWQPWTHSTGPKTPQGKARASQNALKTGTRRADIIALRRALRDQRLFLRAARAVLKILPLS